jgi:hypothetical protein
MGGRSFMVVTSKTPLELTAAEQTDVAFVSESC